MGGIYLAQVHWGPFKWADWTTHAIQAVGPISILVVSFTLFPVGIFKKNTFQPFPKKIYVVSVPFLQVMKVANTSPCECADFVRVDILHSCCKYVSIMWISMSCAWTFALYSCCLVLTRKELDWCIPANNFTHLQIDNTTTSYSFDIEIQVHIIQNIVNIRKENIRKEKLCLRYISW
jgi:hypothetical protein